MCLKKTGRIPEAENIFDGLIRLGKERLEGEEIDFFAKFGERITPDDRRAEAHYLMALGYFGKEMYNEAGQEFTESVKFNPNHIWAREYFSRIR